MIHIHNGDVVAELARRSGLPGEHLPFRETLTTGPTTRDTEARARFMSEAYGEHPLRARNALLNQERALDDAQQSDEIVLWFEHDLFCLVNLVSLLDRFASCRRLTLVWSSEQLSVVEDLGALFESRAAVTPRMMALGREAWSAFTSSDPTLFHRFIQRDASDFPFLREAVTLHASRFPSVRTGLGSIELRLLDLIHNGSSDFATLFQDFDAAPPRFGFGDVEVMRILRVLANLAVPLITIREEPATPLKALFTLTPAADNVMNGKVDYVSVNDPDYWLGGVHLTRDNVWRWDERKREILRS